MRRCPLAKYYSGSGHQQRCLASERRQRALGEASRPSNASLIGWSRQTPRMPQRLRYSTCPLEETVDRSRLSLTLRVRCSHCSCFVYYFAGASFAVVPQVGHTRPSLASPFFALGRVHRPYAPRVDEVQRPEPGVPLPHTCPLENRFFTFALTPSPLFNLACLQLWSPLWVASWAAHWARFGPLVGWPPGPPTRLASRNP